MKYDMERRRDIVVLVHIFPLTVNVNLWKIKSQFKRNIRRLAVGSPIKVK